MNHNHSIFLKQKNFLQQYDLAHFMEFLRTNNRLEALKTDEMIIEALLAPDPKVTLYNYNSSQYVIDMVYKLQELLPVLSLERTITLHDLEYKRYMIKSFLLMYEAVKEQLSNKYEVFLFGYADFSMNKHPLLANVFEQIHFLCVSRDGSKLAKLTVRNGMLTSGEAGHMVLFKFVPSHNYISTHCNNILDLKGLDQKIKRNTNNFSTEQPAKVFKDCHNHQQFLDGVIEKLFQTEYRELK